MSREEAKAKAFDQLAAAGKDESLEAEFAQLQGGTVDSDLAKLKAAREQKMLPPTMAKQIAAPEA